VSMFLGDNFGTNDLVQVTLAVAEATEVAKTSNREAAAVVAGKFSLCASFSNFTSHVRLWKWKGCVGCLQLRFSM
jgi:hypothetical protein